MMGNVLHERVHNEQIRERRGDVLIVRGLRVVSHQLGTVGQCDAVEFHCHPAGVSLHGVDGLWMPYPIEYKRGRPKVESADRLQMCAQAMCLEEMLCCNISEGALFYGETHRREVVPLSMELRAEVVKMFQEMHDLYSRGRTPKVKPSQSCRACSLEELCVPKLCRNLSARKYISEHLHEGSDL